jgi:large subunit ribosomal protein L25
MTDLKMKIERRANTGKNFVDKMRNDKIIPGVVYSRGGETSHISINELEFMRVYKVAGSSSLLKLELDGGVVPAVIKEIQRHPVKNQILHVDFQKINMDEKIKMTIPITIINRDNIKLQPSVLVQLLDQIEVECLPGDIPDSIEVDVENMDFDTPILLGDLDIAKDENIAMLRELDEVICTLNQPALVVEEDEEEETTETTESVEEDKE